MSYDLMVLDKHKRFKNHNDFVKWFEQEMDWEDDIDYNDYRHTTPSLQSWFLEMKDLIRPMNGEFAPSEEEVDSGDFLDADYVIDRECIYVAFAWSDAERALRLVKELALKHDVAFYDASGSDEVVYPDGEILQPTPSDGREAAVHLPPNSAGVRSEFSRKYFGTTPVLVALGIMGMTLPALVQSPTWPVVVVSGSIVLVALAIWLSMLKTITILSDGMEVKRTFLPFVKRFYWFTEFDYSQVDVTRTGESVFRLISQGERVVNISSYVYANYHLLSALVPVRDKSHFTRRSNAEVRSVFNKWNLWGLGGLFGLFVAISLFMIADAAYEGNLGMILFGVFMLALFGAFLLIALSSFDIIAIWNGQFSVRRLVWPFKVETYLLDDMDGCYRVLVKSNGQLGLKDKESWWIVKDKRLMLSFSEPYYKNYEELKDACQITFLGHLTITELQSWRFQLNRKIDIF
ncbi:MAG: hypothetical protein IJP74_01330 [Prevotella sp.]|nr:hypothetical protein [Prevotella sp.]